MSPAFLDVVDVAFCLVSLVPPFYLHRMQYSFPCGCFAVISEIGIRFSLVSLFLFLVSIPIMVSQLSEVGA